ncbi:MAG: hypothetical protein IJM25_04320 [Eubacterium sp.]|nr:hypothetical protein [Eubacterium sp.]
MKYLDLIELTREIAKATNCSLEAADSFVKTQDVYFDKTGVNIDPNDASLTSPEPAVVDDADMIRYIAENAGMAESFVRRLADAEREYMEKNGYINEKGSFVPFVKGRNNK